MQFTDLIENRSPGTFVRFFRKRAERTQEELADDADLSRPYIGALERMDRENPSDRILNSIIRALDLNETEADIIRDGFQHWPLTPITEAEDRFFNRKFAREIWLIGHIPSNHREAYLDTVIRDVKRGVKHVYWTPEEIPNGIIRAVLSSDTDITQADVSGLVQHIKTPSEAGFSRSSLYRYDTQNSAYRVYNCIDSNTPELLHWCNTESDLRIRDRLWGIYSRLTLMREQGKDPEWQSYKWNTLLDL